MRTLKTGYRIFKCSDCRKFWKSATRDIDSPSGEHCIDDDCFGSVDIIGCKEQPLPTDHYGNLDDSVDQKPIEISSLETVK